MRQEHIQPIQLHSSGGGAMVAVLNSAVHLSEVQRVERHHTQRAIDLTEVIAASEKRLDGLFVVGEDSGPRGAQSGEPVIGARGELTRREDVAHADGGNDEGGSAQSAH